MNKTDKRYIANQEAIQKIGSALTSLMNEMPFSDITVSQIINKAGVARATYYRNFATKEEVLIKMVDHIMEEYHQKSKELNAKSFSYDSILLIFQYFKQYKSVILPVFHSGLAYIYLDLFDQELEDKIGHMKYNDIERYRVYFYSGALYNVFLKWIENNMEESCEEMAKITSQLIR